MEDQIALAKWCLKYHLNDEARFHWANVLKINPQHADALRALDLHRYKGRLLTSAEFTALRNGPSAQLREHFAASLAVMPHRSGRSGPSMYPSSESIPR